ncbi:MAG: armadillo-type protein [Benjaminiella poitrasii]|nr:MAG: armadillo-type protein [Benjaminiella poitrasii]
MTSSSSSAPVFMDSHYPPHHHVTATSYSNHNHGNSSQQHKLLNRVSTLFGGGKKKTSTATTTTTVTTILDESSLSQVDSILNDDRNASCVDSMYSSLQSRRSTAYRPTAANNNANHTTPAPLKTVQLENPIVHLPTPTTPPLHSPPAASGQQQQQQQQQQQHYHHHSKSSTPSPPPPLQRKSSPSSPSSTLSPRKIEDVEAQFKLLLREYAPSADHMNNVNKLTVEQKEMLLRSSRSPALLRKNSSFSHVMPSFSLKATFGLKNKRAEHPFFNAMEHQDMDHSNSPQSTSKRANTAPGRYRRTVVPDSYSMSRSKSKSTPEYFVMLLKETHVRDLEDSEVLDLRVFLRSVVVSWTSEFLAQGGYEAIANLFKQMKDAPKRMQNDDRIIQHLGKCLKTIMTHEPMGTQIVLRNPIALSYVRDLLFGPPNKKQKQVYGLEISTRILLLNLMCTLATIQTNSRTTDYVHGYDVLRRLLLDKPSDALSVEDGTNDKKGQPKHPSPFPITLKTDPKEVLQMIMENDPNGAVIGNEYEWDRQELRPRYTAWMRELHSTVERHIETITFLAQVLNYDFKSAYRQIKTRQQYAKTDDPNTEAPGAVMTEEGVVDYIVTHLRLIRTVVTTQPTSYTGHYDEQEQEKMRLELMLSGFDKISKILIQCPHPTVRASYINYLKPLMIPCADLTIPNNAVSSSAIPPPPPPPLPTRRQAANHHSQPGSTYLDDPSSSFNHHHTLTPSSAYSEDDEDNYEISVYAEDDTEDVVVHHPQYHHQQSATNKQWQYEEEPYYDDIFQDEEYIEDHFNSTDDDNDDDNNVRHSASSSF